MINNHRISIFIFVQFFLFTGILNAFSQVSENDNLVSECYMIMVGKDATTDGSVLIAHNNDLTGTEISFCEKNPRNKYLPGDSIQFSNGLTLQSAPITYEWIVLRTRRGYIEGDAVAINEYQVAIGGGVSLKNDRNLKARIADPMILKGLPGGVRYIALQQTKTARQCVELIGDLYNKYGIAYPSGVSIADPNEIWYLETGGGSTWAAIRVPDSCYWVQANGYRIGNINIYDTANVITSPALLDFCKKKGLWDPGMESFNFRKTFGGMVYSSENPYYNSRREWRGISIFSPFLNLDPESRDFPMFFKPDEKINIEKLFSILRDHYQGTEFDGYPDTGKSSGERLIASSKCVHSDVIQLRGKMKADIGAIIWVCLSRPFSSPYVPFYFGIKDIPLAYSGIPEDKRTAFSAFRKLSDLIIGKYNEQINIVLPQWKKFEKINFTLQPSVEDRALKLLEKDIEDSREFLTNFTKGQCSKVLRQTGEMIMTIMPPPKQEENTGNNVKTRKK
ncbi:MAG: C69 family dipeptidase [Bacteroidetes bacterium]|nr:C69 family dipeptidase [Bacteroidota bacterium]